MPKIFVEPKEALRHVLDEYFTVCSSRGVDYLRPEKGIGELLASPQLTVEEQTFFWRYFITAINVELRNAEFNRQDFWQGCIDQGLNPLHVVSMVESKVFKWNGSSVDLITYIPTEGGLEFLKDPMQNPAAMNQHLQRWDSLVIAALTMKTAYTVPPDVLNLKERSLPVRLIDHIFQATGCSNFIQTSSQFQTCLAAWFEAMKGLDARERTTLIIRCLSAVIQAGAYKRDPVPTELNPERSPENLKLVLRLIQDLGLREEDWNHLHDQQVALKCWMQAYLKQPCDQVDFATAVAALNNDALAQQGLSALITQPEVAGEVLSRLPPERAFKLFGETLRAEIGNFPEQGIRKLADLIVLIDAFREVFLAYGMDIKGHPCLDNLCVSLDAAEHFFAQGFIRKSPDIIFSHRDGIGAFNGRLDAHAWQNWRIVEDGEADRAVDLLTSLGKQDLLLKAVKTWIETNTRPNCFHEGVFHRLVVSFFNDALIDSATVQSWVSNADQVKRLQAIGVSAQALQECKAFKRNQEDFLSRDLGL